MHGSQHEKCLNPFGLRLHSNIDPNPPAETDQANLGRRGLIFSGSRGPCMNEKRRWSRTPIDCPKKSRSHSETAFFNKILAVSRRALVGQKGSNARRVTTFNDVMEGSLAAMNNRLPA